MNIGTSAPAPKAPTLGATMIWVLASLAAGVVGGLASPPGEWYAALSKPQWNPPNWVFSPVWTTLYVMMGLAAAFAWPGRATRSGRVGFLLFGLQLALNALWSWIFFRWHRLDLAFVELTVLGYQALEQALPEVFRKTGMSFPEEMRGGGPPRITRCIPPPLEGAWVVDSVATLPGFRRRGIAGRLLESILKIGPDRGFKQAQINIYIGNIPAQCAYEKHGFRSWMNGVILFLRERLVLLVWPAWFVTFRGIYPCRSENPYRFDNGLFLRSQSVE